MGTTVWLHRPSRRLTDDSIEPSCGVLDVWEGSTHKYRIVIDCGITPVHHAKAGKPSWYGPNTNIFRDGKKIDAIFITHIHEDHVGFLPALEPFMSSTAKVWMTTPSWHMVKHGFEDTLKITERLHTRSAFTGEQLDKSMARRAVIAKPGAFEVLPGIECYAHAEGHINGAASFTFRIGKRKFHYSGDRCDHDQPGILGAEPLPKEWHPDVVAQWDCTYGADRASNSRVFVSEMDRAAAYCHDARDRITKIMFFAFSKHRGGSLATGLKRSGFDGMIHMDGGCRYFSEAQTRPEGRWSKLDSPFDLSNVRMVTQSSRREIAKSPSYGVITTNGMGGPGGTGTFWRAEILPDPDAIAVFTGYVAPGTDGEQILKANAERVRTGIPQTLNFDEIDENGVKKKRTMQLRCRVEQVRIGSHPNQNQITEDLERYRPETAILTHGSKASLTAVEQALQGSIPRLIRADIEQSVEVDC